MTSSIGDRTPRVEDRRFVSGSGRYVADVDLPGQLYGVVVRSEHAAARIRSIDTAAAAALDGVAGVFTADDIGDSLGTPSITLERFRPDGSPMFWRPQSALARDRVRFVGEPVAFVVADTPAHAQDAAEAVAIDYEPHEAVVDLLGALEDRGVRVWEENPDNVSNIHEMGDRDATDEAFGRAARIVRRRYRISRVHAQYLEPRAAVGRFDADAGRYVLYCDVQGPHQLRTLLARDVFRVDPDKVHVIAQDIGGGFGGKAAMIEHRLILWAAERLGRPVKWQSDRGETILGAEHGRDNAHEVELALDADGRFLALRAHWVANVGAYINGNRNFQSSFVNVPGILGVYRFPAAFVRSTCVMTNVGPVAPYRGAGRPEATFVLERVIDDAARELGIDRIRLRQMNMIAPDELPLTTPLGFSYDCGDFRACMDRALAMADWDGFPDRRAASEARGRLRGIGLANPIERAGGPSPEYARVAVDRDGRIELQVGTKNHGQGHETAFRQILGSTLGPAAEEVAFVDGDTDRVAEGTGTFGSRSSSIGGTSVLMAAEKIVETGRRIAAHMMEVSPADVAFEDGRFAIVGTDRSVSFKEVAGAAHDPDRALPGDLEPGWAEHVSYKPDDCTFPYGTHVCEVEVDPDTGAVQIVSYAVIDDVGTMINPQIVEGQVHGGIAQGAGQALMEAMVYDPDSGQCLTGAFTDYAMPRASDFCPIELGEFVTPTTRNPLGVKGAGEAGAVGALAAVTNAVMDALAPAGVTELAMPATASTIWQALRKVS